jgi:hypothetical protein
MSANLLRSEGARGKLAEEFFASRFRRFRLTSWLAVVAFLCQRRNRSPGLGRQKT